MNTYTPTTLGYTILGLLHQEPRSGYAIRKVFETTPMGHYSSSPGTIYPALNRLQAEGLIEKIVAPKQPSGKKNVFCLTSTGREILAAWLRKPVTRDDATTGWRETLLRFAFMDHFVDKEHKVAFLQAFQLETTRYVEELRNLLEQSQNVMPLHGQLALENGVRLFQAHAEWAAHALEVIKAQG